LPTRARFSPRRRVLRAGARFAIFDLMRTGDGELSYPLPWASTADTNAIVSPGEYRNALSAAGVEIVSERERRDVALDYFARQRAQAAAAPSAIRTVVRFRLELCNSNGVSTIAFSIAQP